MCVVLPRCFLTFSDALELLYKQFHISHVNTTKQASTHRTTMKKSANMKTMKCNMTDQNMHKKGWLKC